MSDDLSDTLSDELSDALSDEAVSDASASSIAARSARRPTRSHPLWRAIFASIASMCDASRSPRRRIASSDAPSFSSSSAISHVASRRTHVAPQHRAASPASARSPPKMTCERCSSPTPRSNESRISSRGVVSLPSARHSPRVTRRSYSFFHVSRGTRVSRSRETAKLPPRYAETVTGDLASSALSSSETTGYARRSSKVALVALPLVTPPPPDVG